MSNDRYQRHSLIDWFSQEDVSKMTVGVIGVGAVGNEVLKNLTLLGVGTIHIFDLDKIEIHNLTRSVLFRESDIGRTKVDAASERAQELDPNIKIISHHGDFWNEITASSITDFDVIFCCVDNFEARININKLCYLRSVDLVVAGIDSKFISVEKFPFSSTPKAPCFECSLPPSVYSRIAQRYSCGWLKKISYIERKIPTTAITSSVSGSMAVSWGLRFGTISENGNESEATELMSRRMLFDTISGRSQISEISKLDNCPCCGNYEPANVLISASPKIDGRFFGDKDLEISDITLWSSDQILTGYHIGTKEKSEEFIVVFDRASDHSDRFASTVSDDPENVLVDITDQFTLNELKTSFYGQTIPAKFLLMRENEDTILIDLEESKDV
jgi:molybdopterin-synthase adenylyltransferase